METEKSLWWRQERTQIFPIIDQDVSENHNLGRNRLGDKDSAFHFTGELTWGSGVVFQIILAEKLWTQACISKSQIQNPKASAAFLDYIYLIR